MESIPNPLLLVVVLFIVAMGPFIAVVVSSYAKIVVVAYLLRNALGIQQIPPNVAINGLAIILSVYIMAPIGFEIFETLSTTEISVEQLQNPETQNVILESAEPLRDFLLKHSNEQQRTFFASSATKLWPERYARDITPEHLLILLPAFTMSELTSAFEIGFLLYLPFIVIDLIVSNILLAMGMMMMSPLTVSLPFKLLLFVLVDGWTRLIHGLVLSYQ